MSAHLKTGKVNAFRCVECEVLFLDPDGPLYECSKCSGRQVGAGENRCDECHVFMGKVSDTCCPECGYEEIASVEAWRGADGKLYDSERAEREWLAKSPERTEAAESNRAFMERHFAEMAEANRLNNAKLLPKLYKLRELLVGRAPALMHSVTYNIDSIERDPADGGTITAMLYFKEMAELFAPELSQELFIASLLRSPSSPPMATMDAGRVQFGA